MVTTVSITKSNYLLKCCIYLGKEGWFLIFKEHAEWSSHVKIHNTQQGNCRCPNSWVSRAEGCLHIVDKTFHIYTEKERLNVSFLDVVSSNSTLAKASSVSQIQKCLLPSKAKFLHGISQPVETFCLVLGVLLRKRQRHNL